jgi:hypothetical protein
MNGMDSYRGDYGKMSKLTLALMEDSGWWGAGWEGACVLHEMAAPDLG